MSKITRGSSAQGVLPVGQGSVRPAQPPKTASEHAAVYEGETPQAVPEPPRAKPTAPTAPAPYRPTPLTNPAVRAEVSEILDNASRARELSEAGARSVRQVILRAYDTFASSGGDPRTLRRFLDEAEKRLRAAGFADKGWPSAKGVTSRLLSPIVAQAIRQDGGWPTDTVVALNRGLGYLRAAGYTGKEAAAVLESLDGPGEEGDVGRRQLTRLARAAKVAAALGLTEAQLQTLVATYAADPRDDINAHAAALHQALTGSGVSAAVADAATLALDGSFSNNERLVIHGVVSFASLVAFESIGRSITADVRWAEVQGAFAEISRALEQDPADEARIAEKSRVLGQLLPSSDTDAAGRRQEIAASVERMRDMAVYARVTRQAPDLSLAQPHVNEGVVRRLTDALAADFVAHGHASPEAYRLASRVLAPRLRAHGGFEFERQGSMLMVESFGMPVLAYAQARAVVATLALEGTRGEQATRALYDALYKRERGTPWDVCDHSLRDRLQDDELVDRLLAELERERNAQKDR